VPRSPDALSSPPARPPLRRLAIVVGVWVALAGGALLTANALDSPVGEGSRDAAQPVAPGPVAEADPPVAGLPAFAMILDHPLPPDVVDLPPAEQAESLRLRAISTRDAARFVELGSVMQTLGDAQSAQFSYQSALTFDPESVAARVGLAVAAGTSGADGLDLAAQRLRGLATTYPRSQVVSFNQAWVEIYRRRGDLARAALKRTVALGAETRLGAAATALLDALDQVGAGEKP
jgi:hypothetical protein